MLIDLNTYKSKEDIPYEEMDIVCFREQISGGTEDYQRVWKMNIIESDGGYKVLMPRNSTFALPGYGKRMSIPNLVVDVIDTNIIEDLEKQEQTCINTLNTLKKLREDKELMRLVYENKN